MPSSERSILGFGRRKAGASMMGEGIVES